MVGLLDGSDSRQFIVTPNTFLTSSTGQDPKDDPELEAIRQRRMQELMAQRGVGNPQNGEQQKAQEDAKSLYLLQQ
ncbi:DNA-binding protein [Cinnamomum micranthum f. kanehirae]|uniref:DNA-binding protein n=1 Tax=Cinnamomum micranthum f. kanehirae TaxID=337451 RepID=A0A443PZG3_9MAGN|nr:DNA-binding protein [Cinnamomum micranthum f. kanehirae]